MNGFAVGLDLVDVERVARLLERSGKRALERILTPGEREYCLTQLAPARHVAARVAAKEAAYKALAQGGAERVVWWRDVEVVRDARNRPSLVFHGRARACAEELQVAGSLLSLTHSETQAAAVVILLR